MSSFDFMMLSVFLWLTAALWAVTIFEAINDENWFKAICFSAGTISMARWAYLIWGMH